MKKILLALLVGTAAAPAACYDLSFSCLYQQDANVQYNSGAVFLSNNNIYARSLEAYLRSARRAIRALYEGCRTPYPASGSVKWKALPLPSSLSTHRRPPWAVMNSRAMLRPRPEPPW